MYNVYLLKLNLFIEIKFIILRRLYKFDYGFVGWGWIRFSGGSISVYFFVRRGGVGFFRC